MLKFIVQRLISLVPVLLALTAIVFILLEIAPGDAATIQAGPDSNPEAIAELRVKMGLDDPLVLRYLKYLGRVSQGDLGTSTRTEEPVTTVIARTLPRTASVSLLAIVLAVLISVPIALLVARRAGSTLDRVVTSFTAPLMATPAYLLAQGMVLFLAIGGLKWFPSSGYVPLTEDFSGWLHHATLPAIALGAISLAELTRMLRGSMIDTLREDYIVTARATGAGEFAISTQYAAKNAAIPFVTVLGLQIGRILGTSVVIDTIFNIQGIGYLAFTSVLARDTPTLMGVVLVGGLLVLVVNMLVDLVCAILNPRMREEV